MTPTATIPAGRSGRGNGSGSTRFPNPHRPGLSRQPAPKSARRVSGPVKGRSTRPSAARRTAPRATVARPPLLPKSRAFVKSLPDHPVIDRLVRGRAWILALGVMLAGIVAMQVEILKLGANIGRSVQRTSALELRNEQLQASVASLADDQRIEKAAAGMGMVMSPPGSVGFVNRSPAGNVNAALANLHAPSATTFGNTTSSNGLVVTPSVIAAANAPAAGSTSASPTSAAASGPVYTQTTTPQSTIAGASTPTGG